MQQSQLAIILLAHGSRDPLWRRPIEAVAARIQTDQPRLLVRCAYLELCAPDLAGAVAELARQNQVPRGTLVDLLRGQNKGRYGQAHRGAIVLGLKPEPATSH